jgi:hypothetical protein
MHFTAMVRNKNATITIPIINKYDSRTGVAEPLEFTPTMSMIFKTEQMLSLIKIWTSNIKFPFHTQNSPQDLGVKWMNPVKLSNSGKENHCSLSQLFVFNCITGEEYLHLINPFTPPSHVVFFVWACHT